MTSRTDPIAGAAPVVRRLSLPTWLACGVAFGSAAWFLFGDGIAYLLQIWTDREEYSHAYLIPLISLFLVWQRRNELTQLEFRGAWVGVAIVLLGVVLGLIGRMATVYIVQQVGLVLAVCGFVLAMTGWSALRLLWMPLLLLFTIIPLPDFLQVKVSSGMQLVSSSLGVWFLRLIGVSVYLEGNVIDLGVYRLQVAEACDGLRYLFPLMTLGLVLAYFYKGATWKRVLIFLSSIPLTILLNSLRIASIGVLVEHWGIGMAEGFLHEFQGWAVFMLSFALMVLLMIGLSRVGKDARPWRELFGLEFPAPTPRGVPRSARPVPPSLVGACVVLLAAAAGSIALPARTEVVPARTSFAAFPATLAGQRVERKPLEAIYLDTLKLDDYLMADVRGPQGAPVNLYVAWYDSQQSGRSAHSPSTCLPGGGWEMKEFGQVDVPGVAVEGRQLRVNRALIAMGPNRQLVYYWFQQRGRVLTNEYLVKWYLFWDALTRRRTDGALVRLTAPLVEGQDVTEADRELADFARETAPRLRAYIPD
jgi:exosortase D (VPLPA-CTERM-specific)